MAQRICEVLLIEICLKAFKLERTSPIKIYCDNKAANNIAHNPIQHDCTKRIEVDKHFIKEKVKYGKFSTHFVTNYQATTS